VKWGIGSVASFLGNEVKDEVLSQMTGGASDVLDITKAGTKLLKETVFSGGLSKVNVIDDAADALASKLGGQSSVKFKNDPNAREFDAISDEFIAQAKESGVQVGKKFRKQAKASFQAAQDTGRKVYYEFQNAPSDQVRNKLNEYSERYGVDLVIDIVNKE
jgi:hypothetical protein